MKLSSLLYHVDQGNLALAPFAHSFGWSPQLVIRLFDSLYQGFPIGEIVLQDTFTVSAAEPKELTQIRATTMIVDGTQRITALYVGIRGRKPSFTPENEVVTCPLRFNVAHERFAVFAPAMVNDPNWIDLAELFATHNSGVGKALYALYSSNPADPAFSESVRRLNRLASIADRQLSVQYMPPGAAESACQEFFNLTHGIGN